jgi:hypothetical protein
MTHPPACRQPCPTEWNTNCYCGKHHCQHDEGHNGPHQHDNETYDGRDVWVIGDA